MIGKKMSALRSTVLVTMVLAAFLLLTHCTERGREAPDVSTAAAERTDTVVRLVYPPWSSEIASAHLFQAVIQRRLGYRVELIPVDAEEMWASVARGEADILTGAWLPETHRGYMSTYGGDVDDLGPNVEGARIGLVVPTMTPGRQTDATGRTGLPLVTISSIEELPPAADRFAGRIIGIESGAGVVARTKEALETYDLYPDFRLIESDEEIMVDRVGEAIYRGNWIVFTGWRPHWMFERYNLRFLEDPRGVYGGTEEIHTMVRRDLATDMPELYRVLDRITYSPADLERLMRWIHEDTDDDPYAQALRWIESHEDIVDSWVGGSE